MGWESIIALDKFSLYMVICQVLDGIFTCRFTIFSVLHTSMVQWCLQWLCFVLANALWQPNRLFTFVKKVEDSLKIYLDRLSNINNGHIQIS